MTVMSPLSCRGLKAISQMPCVRSTDQRGSSCRCVCWQCIWIHMDRGMLPTCLTPSISLPPLPPLISYSCPPPLSPLYLPIYLHPSFLPPPSHPGCQASICCYGNDRFSKDLPFHSWSHHLCSCCCCHHRHPAYHVRLLLSCTAGVVCVVCPSSSLLCPSSVHPLHPPSIPSHIMNLNRCVHCVYLYLVTALQKELLSTVWILCCNNSSSIYCGLVPRFLPKRFCHTALKKNYWFMW